MLAEVPEVMQGCEEHEERGEHLITDLRRNRGNKSATIGHRREAVIIPGPEIQQFGLAL